MCKNPRFVDQAVEARFAAVSARMTAAREVLSRQGAIVASWRVERGLRMGPYFRVAFREAGRQASIYLGKSADLVEKARALLAEFQAPARLDRTIRRATAAGKAALRACKARMKGLMSACGLYARGWDVFGWRQIVRKPQFPTLKSLIRREEARAFRQIGLPRSFAAPPKNSGDDWAKDLGLAPLLPRWATDLARRQGKRSRGATATSAAGPTGG